MFPFDNPFMNTVLPIALRSNANEQIQDAPEQLTPKALSIHEKYDETSPMAKVLALLLPEGPQPPASSLGARLAWDADVVAGLPRRALLAAPGSLLHQIGATESTGADAVTEALQKTLESPITGPALKMTPAGAALGLLGQTGSPAMQRVALETLTDPLTLVGGPGKAISKGIGDTLLARAASRAPGFAAGAAGSGLGAVPLASTLTRSEKALAAGAQGLYTVDDVASAMLGGFAHRLVQGAQAGLAPINAGIGRTLPSLPKWTELGARTSLAGDVAQMLESRGIDVSTDRIMVTQAPTDLLDTLPQSMRSKFGLQDLGDLVGAAPGANSWDDALMGYGAKVRGDMGLKSPGAAERFYNELTSWWKRQALTSAAYPITNALGGALGYAAEGGNPFQIARDLVANAGAIWRGDSFHLQDAAELSEATGMPIPDSLRQGASRATASQIGVNASQRAGRDAVILGALGAMGAGPAGAVVGAAAGYGLAKAAARVQKVSQGIETVLRERGWVHGMGSELVDAAQEMEGVVRQAMAGSPGSSAADAVSQFIHANGGQVSAQNIRQHLLGHAVDRDVADAAAETIDDILYNASQKGKATSDAFNFNYDDLSNIERLISNVAPFSTWTLKAIPYYATKSAEHPWTLALLNDWNAESSKERRERGLTSRVAGALPWDSGSVLASAILGRPTDIWVNPIASLIPAGNLNQGLDRMEYSDSTAGKVLGAADALGLGVNPLMGLGLRVAGVGDQDEPSEGIPLRSAGAIQGLTGVDLGKGTRQLETAIRESLPGRGKVTDLGELATARRVDELALRDTGQTITSKNPIVVPYLQAKLTKSGPLWDRAAAEVNQERGLGAAIGWVNSQIRPQALVSKEESAIRQAGAERILSQDFGKKLQAIRPTPGQRVPDDVLQEMAQGLLKISQRTGEPVPQNALDIMADPTVAHVSQLAEDIFQWERQQSPLLAGYSESGSPERRELQAALAVYGNPLTQEERQAATVNRKPGANPASAINSAEYQARQRLLHRYPALGDYLSWKRTHEDGGLDGFLGQMKPR